MISTDYYHIVLNFNQSPDYRCSNISIVTIRSRKMASSEPIKAKVLGTGVVELYREFENDNASDSHPHKITECDDTIVAIIAIPTYFTATDILGFVGESYLKHITHIRIIKSDKPNRFLLLFKFREIVQAAAFQNRFNGKPFNLMEPETCHTIFVKSVQIRGLQGSRSGPVSDLIPFLVKDPFTGPEEVSSSGKVTLPADTLVELPTCPVCLERMDSAVTGLLTIPCQHTFHCQCLSRWKDDSCPICRYSNTKIDPQVLHAARRFSLLNTRPQLRPAALESNSSSSSAALLRALNNNTAEAETREACASCSDLSGLWICLVCGNVGCSRYSPQQHSLKHFTETGHCFAMELDTSRVWNYASDSYVHRLVANQPDGKLVELPGKDETTNDSSKAQQSTIDKVEEVGFEYSQLLISQLASQQEYYEALLQKPSTAKGPAPSLYLDFIAEKDLRLQVAELAQQVKELTLKTVPSLRQKLTVKDEKIGKLSHDLDAANSLNEALSKKLDHLEQESNKYGETISQLRNENQGLNEQVTDLMFFLDNKEKFENELEDAKNGTIVIQQPSRPPQRKSQLKRKK